MRVGDFDKRVRFYAKVTSRDEHNATVTTWPEVTIKTWGQFVYRGGNKTLSAEERFYSQSAELLVRYNTRIVEGMRVEVEGTMYEITNLEEIPRRDGWRIMLEKINK